MDKTLMVTARRSLGALGLVLAMLTACTSDPETSGSPSGSSSSSSGGATCSKAKTHLAKCSTDSDCYSGNCSNGSCYVGEQDCSSNADCAPLAPSSAYLTTCFEDSVKHGCAIYCLD